MYKLRSCKLVGVAQDFSAVKQEYEMSREVYSYSYWVVAERGLITSSSLLIALLACAPFASAAEPLPCTDKRVVHNLKQAYEVTLMGSKSGRQFQVVEDVRGTGSGFPPSSVNQYTPSKDHYNKSRYCEARIRLDNGETDQAYFRIDGLKDGPETDFNFDPCFLRNDVAQNCCGDQRPSQ